LAVVDPEKLVPNPVPPPVVIEELVVDGTTHRSIPANDGDETPADAVKAILKVPPGKHRLEFHYAALSFTAPEEVRFKYRLEGLEKNWQEGLNARSVSYPQVPPGDYNFHVIACNNDGVWNESGASLAVMVLPYFWERTWFLTLTTFIVLGAVAGMARYIGWRKLQRRLERAERESAIAKERARIANDIHDDLGANLTEIVLLSELAQNTEAPAQEVQSDLSKITAKARDLTRLLDGIVWAVDPENDTLDNFVTYACNFAQDYLRLAKISCRLDIPDDLPHVALPTDLRHNLFMVFKETLHNVVKHSEASEVRIQFTHQPGTLQLVIRDNGKGFHQPPVLENTSMTASTAEDRDPNKSGLLNMRKRIEQFGGQFELSSQPQAGTEVKMTVNLPAT
jgi:signal transduction histidine kinase